MKVDIDTQNEILVKQLIAGDLLARDKLIEFNQRLVYTTVKRVLRVWHNFQHLRDDLIGVGMVALVKAVNRLLIVGEAARPVRNYLITVIRSKLLTELIGQDGRRGQAAHYRMTQYVATYSQVPEHILAVTDRSFDRIENREYLLSLCESVREREIISHYLDGRSPGAIIANTGLSRNVVHKTFEQFREKLTKSQNACRKRGSFDNHCSEED